MEEVFKKQFSSVIPLDIPKIDPKTVRDTKRKVQDRANNLLPGAATKVPSEAVEYVTKVNIARANTMENPWYKFISLVSGLSTEPMSKLWKKQDLVEKQQALLNETNSGVFSALNVGASQQYQGGGLVKNTALQQEEQNVSQYVTDRRDFLSSPEVYGKLFLTPLIFAHINEAQQLIENLCNTSIDVDELIKTRHATYFARLVALRMNTSRFLGGRYYHLNSNFGRLQMQTNRLMAYFKQHFGGSTSMQEFTRVYPNRLNQQLLTQSLAADQCSVPMAGSLHQPGTHSYFQKLGEI